jgi:hypothetical protein
MKKRSVPPPVFPDPDDPQSWKVVIEPRGLWPWTPYRVYLQCGGIRYGAGETAWGWSCITLAGARRRGRRELARMRARLRRTRRIRRRIEADSERTAS